MSYVGLKINITAECEDVCQGAEVTPLLKQKDCYTGNYHGVYYAYDERVQTCFSFDPRDENRVPLYTYVSEADKEKEEKRQLTLTNSRDLAATGSCSSLKDCFTCEGATASLCAWTNNQCGQNLKAKAQQWYEAYLGCEDTLGLCQTAKQNATFSEYS